MSNRSLMEREIPYLKEQLLNGEREIYLTDPYWEEIPCLIDP